MALMQMPNQNGSCILVRVMALSPAHPQQTLTRMLHEDMPGTYLVLTLHALNVDVQM